MPRKYTASGTRVSERRRYERRVKSDQRAHEAQVKRLSLLSAGVADPFGGPKDGYVEGGALYYANDEYAGRDLSVRKDVVASMKAELGCAACGEKRPEVLAFHHRDPATKSFNIGSGSGVSILDLAAEARKCDVLCMNCHALVHAGALLRYRDSPDDGSKRAPLSKFAMRRQKAA